jgi:hypothetical protein
MYDCDCPYCKEVNTFFEVDGAINRYIPRICENCGKIFYYLQRSWFDPYYDNTNVEIRKQEWVNKKIKDGKLEECGSMKNKDGKIVAHIYKPLWDIYRKFGGEAKVLKQVKKIYGEGIS